MASCALAGCTLEDPLLGDVENCGSPNNRCIDVLEHASKVECKDLRDDFQELQALYVDHVNPYEDVYPFKCSAVECASGFQKVGRRVPTATGQQCSAETCVDGYEDVEKEKGIVYVCEKNDNMCDVAELCQSADGWQDGVCVKIDQTPTCISTACQAGYHLVPSTRPCPENRCMQNIYCSEDTEDHCGGADIRCSKIDGWKGGSCEDAQCVVKSCANGRFASEGRDACLLITNEQCGSEARSCIPPMKCDGVGECVEACSTGKTECEDVGCVDTTSNIDHCGACGKSCSIKASLADRVACSNSKCVIASCAPGYYLIAGQCVIPGDEVIFGRYHRARIATRRRRSRGKSLRSSKIRPCLSASTSLNNTSITIGKKTSHGNIAMSALT